MKGYIGLLKTDENTAFLPTTITDAIKHNDRLLSVIIRSLIGSVSDLTEHITQVQQDGFFVVDESGNIGFQVTKDTNTTSKPSTGNSGFSEFMSETVLTGFFVVDANGNIGFKVGERGVSGSGSSGGNGNFVEVAQDGFYAVDENGYIGFGINKDGVLGSTTSSSYAERPTKGYENFTVDVEYYYDDLNATDGTIVSSYSDGVFKDNAVLALPTSYRSSGEKTRLVIMCGGTAERITATSNPYSDSGLVNGGWKMWLNMGYAVLDVNGIAEGWAQAKGFPKTNLHYSNKFLIQSYYAAYKQVINKYNLYDEVIIGGISMGGSASTMLVYSGKFPVICHCLFAPTISVYKNNFKKPWQYVDQMKTMVGQWNLPKWNEITIHNSDNTYDITDPVDDVRQSRANYFLKYKDYWIGFDNLFQYSFGSGLEDALSNTSNEESGFNSLLKYYPVPVKVWHGTSDSVVETKYSRYFVEMIKRGGGKAWYRPILGGNHEDGWKKGTATLTGVNGTQFTTSVPMAEAYMFVKRWEI